MVDLKGSVVQALLRVTILFFIKFYSWFVLELFNSNFYIYKYKAFNDKLQCMPKSVKMPLSYRFHSYNALFIIPRWYRRSEVLISKWTQAAQQGRLIHNNDIFYLTWYTCYTSCLSIFCWWKYVFFLWCQ